MPTIRASFFSVWNRAASRRETFTPLLPVCAAAPSANAKHNSAHLRTGMHTSEGISYTAAHYWWDMMRGENAAKPAIPGGGNVPLLMRGCISYRATDSQACMAHRRYNRFSAWENLLPRDFRLPDECPRFRESRRHAHGPGLCPGGNTRTSPPGPLQHLQHPRQGRTEGFQPPPEFQTRGRQGDR